MISSISIIIAGHFLFDFIGQGQTLREEKHRDWTALMVHITIYFFGMIATGWLAGASVQWLYINVVAHIGVDAVTSRLSHYYFTNDNIWAGMNVIGLDQMIHVWLLIITFLMIQS